MAQRRFKRKTNVAAVGLQADYTDPLPGNGSLARSGPSGLGLHCSLPRVPWLPRNHLVPLTDVWGNDYLRQFPRPLSQAGFALQHRTLGRNSNKERGGQVHFLSLNPWRKNAIGVWGGGRGERRKAATSEHFLD